MTTAADHLCEAIDVGCTRDDEHDHIADHADEVRAEHTTVFVRWLLKKAAEYRSAGGTAVERHQRALQAEAIELLADKARRGAVRPNNLLMPSGTPAVDPWQALADALNAAGTLGIDLDGTITDHDEHSVVWDREAERWVVAAYDEDEAAACRSCGAALDDENVSDYCSDKCAALAAAPSTEDGAEPIAPRPVVLSAAARTLLTFGLRMVSDQMDKWGEEFDPEGQHALAELRALAVDRTAEAGEGR